MRLVLKVVITAKSLNLFYSSPVLAWVRLVAGGLGRETRLLQPGNDRQPECPEVAWIVRRKWCGAGQLVRVRVECRPGPAVLAAVVAQLY